MEDIKDQLSVDNSRGTMYGNQSLWKINQTELQSVAFLVKQEVSRPRGRLFLLLKK
jgi:hypothetical protein